VGKIEERYDQIEVKTILEPYNPWWNNAAINVPEFKRSMFSRIYADLLSLKQILSISGPRRIGKTTLLKQIIRSLIADRHAEPAQIIYFSFDDPLIIATPLADTFFEKMIKWVDTAYKGQTVYFFLDEIQRLEKWELYLKKYYDLGFPFKFVISGSASSPIFKKSRESLMGRIKEYHLQPFSFREFVYFFGKGNAGLLDFVNKAYDFGKNLQHDIAIDWQVLDTPRSPLHVTPENFSSLTSLLNKYFVEGGFPEVWEFNDIVQKQQYLYDNQIQKVIFEDLVIATEFRKPENLKRFYLSLIEQPGQEINLEKASGKIGVSRTMLHKYLPQLEMTDLVKSIPRFSKRPIKFRRGNVKCYLVDLALRNAILKLGEKILEDQQMLGYYAENLVFNALRNFYGAIELSYCKEGRGEIDFIVNLGSNRLIPVEVKYREQLQDMELIKGFMRKYDQKLGIVVTKNLDQPAVQDNLLYVPLAIFLLFF
jgi:predicted AAA+ superfamily ATPase